MRKRKKKIVPKPCPFCGIELIIVYGNLGDWDYGEKYKHPRNKCILSELKVEKEEDTYIDSSHNVKYWNQRVGEK